MFTCFTVVASEDLVVLKERYDSIVNSELRDVMCLFPLYFPFNQNVNILDSLGSTIFSLFS
jgi:hypothetical protein